MVNAVNVPVQTVAVNSAILFGQTRICTGCSVRHEAGSGRFVALKPGIYKVTFSGNVSIPTGGTVAPIVLDITQDGEIVAGGNMEHTPAAVATPENVSVTVLVQAYPGCCVPIGVRNSSTAPINVEDANFVITREC